MSGEELPSRFAFARIRPTCVGQAIRLRDLGVEVGTGPLQYATGKAPGPAQGQLAVEHHQRLRRVGRHAADRAAFVRIRHVERLEQRVSRVAPNEHIDASAEVLGAILRDVPPVVAHLHARRQFRKHTRPAHLQIEPSGHGQRRIPDEFALEPLAREPPEHAILGIDLDRVGPVVGRLLVCPRGQHEPVQVLDPPAVLDEIDRQPVEQFGMRRGIAHHAEVARRADQAPSEVVMPDAVDDYASGQRVCRVGQPIRQDAPTTGRVEPFGWFDGRGLRVDRREERRFDAFFRFVVNADGKDVRGQRLATHIDHRGAERQRLRIEVRKLIQLLLEFKPAFFRLALEFLDDRFAIGVQIVPDLVEEPPVHGRPLGCGLPDSRLHQHRVFVDVRLDQAFAGFGFEFTHLLAEGRRLGFPDPLLLAITLLDLRRDEGNVVVRPDVREERLQLVVVFLRDRVVLVIVTSGASDGQPEEHRADGIGDVVENLLAALHQVAGVAFIRIVAIERRGHACVRVVGPQFIAGNLFTDEPVVRLVLVERLNDVVAILPDVRAGFVGLEALALGIAGQIEPVSGPALAVVGRRQQAIHDTIERAGCIVGQKRVHLFERRRQTDQIKRHAADQRRLVRGRRMRQSFAFERRDDKSINGVDGFQSTLGRGQFNALERLQRPQTRSDGVVARARIRLGPRQGHAHPPNQDLDFLVGQRLARRHGQVAVVTNGLDQTTGRGLTRHGGRAALAAGENGRARREVKPAFELVAAPMAFEAPRGQQRAHVRLEERIRGRQRCRRIR